MAASLAVAQFRLSETILQLLGAVCVRSLRSSRNSQSSNAQRLSGLCASWTTPAVNNGMRCTRTPPTSSPFSALPSTSPRMRHPRSNKRSARRWRRRLLGQRHHLDPVKKPPPCRRLWPGLSSESLGRRSSIRVVLASARVVRVLRVLRMQLWPSTTSGLSRGACSTGGWTMGTPAKRRGQTCC